ncbi:DUF3253 domain-containing protein [Hyphobacterium sp. HN65]|uniref:DUF3253 domain-containing protein n=1 Tax=Hyphobacterium lacteum TaxID=3116575 RepID=A0ABU7LT92_9PROT|nr:DUF3253 domain-containing protein [Hyphobacterium sp. HN65]MEE2527085.1 DUF3253 domain-containing protein [Hyphobacterium sp. HN65]
MDNDTVEAVIMTLVEARGAGKSICPTDAARELDAEHWRGRLGAVKQAAVRLALAGKVDILRKGKPVDPTDFKGVYRISLHT